MKKPIVFIINRVAKRVPYDFSWPLHQVWAGYLRECGRPDCEGCSRCERIEPPAGPGWQLWETTSEGAPISPVFASLDALCIWAADNATAFADLKLTADEWHRQLARH